MNSVEVKQDVEFAFRVLEFSIRTLCYFELGLCDISRFGQDATILLEEENVGFNDGYFLSENNAVLVSKMNVGAAFGASAIALDKLYEAVRGNRNPASDDQVDMLWALVYAVRNAFSHGIANPKWTIKERYQRVLSIPFVEPELFINLEELNGSSFEYAHIGGFANWMKLKEISYDLLRIS